MLLAPNREFHCCTYIQPFGPYSLLSHTNLSPLQSFHSYNPLTVQHSCYTTFSLYNPFNLFTHITLFSPTAFLLHTNLSLKQSEHTKHIEVQYFHVSFCFCFPLVDLRKPSNFVRLLQARLYSGSSPKKKFFHECIISVIHMHQLLGEKTKCSIC